MSAASYSRTSRPRTDRVSYGRSSAGRAGAASGYRGARYVSSSLAEELSFEEAPSISWCPVPVAAPRARASRRPRFPWRRPAPSSASSALIAMARVAITSAAASCALETRSLQTSIETARRGQRSLRCPRACWRTLAHQGPGHGPRHGGPGPEYGDRSRCLPISSPPMAPAALSLSESVARMKGL
ncbi:MAG: hypothetical protein ACLUE1_05760 [Adlercreutzia equolifaciens]